MIFQMVGDEHGRGRSVHSTPNFQLPTPNSGIGSWELGIGSWFFLVSDVEAALFELALALLAAAVLLDDAAVEEMDGAVGVARVARVVRDHADRRAFTVQLAEQLHDGFAVLRVE